MTQTVPVIDNPSARRLFMDRHGLSEPPVGRLDRQGLLDLIDRIGFVQVDSIRAVERAHDMILFARNRNYRPRHLKTLLERDRSVFENWTHDASIIPTRFYPYWRERFRREEERLRERWTRWGREGFQDQLEDVVGRIRDTGPVMAREVGEDEARSPGGWWEWHPSKAALEYLWRTGSLAIDRREGFQKVYDLCHRVIPDEHREKPVDTDAVVDWACNEALDRLGFATSGEIAAFFDLIKPDEAKAWCARELGSTLIEVDVEGATGGKPKRVFARPDIMDKVRDAPEPPSRLRVLSPFDPMIRDRNRAERLFGFHYRIEIYVPAPKRKYGYYVFPLLEGDRLVGRIDMKCRRDDGVLEVAACWPERRSGLGSGRVKKLEAELDRMRRFTGCERVEFADNWRRDPVFHG